MNSNFQDIIDCVLATSQSTYDDWDYESKGCLHSYCGIDEEMHYNILEKLFENSLIINEIVKTDSNDNCSIIINFQNENYR